MRSFRTLPAILAAALALSACEGASRHQGGDPADQGRQGSEEQGVSTTINDTTPHRPGAGGDQP